MLALQGCFVTIDAMGCQTNITELIIEGEGDYVLALKCSHLLNIMCAIALIILIINIDNICIR